VKKHMKSAAVVLLTATFVFSANAQSVFSARRAPGFSLPDQRLKQHDLQDYKGKVVVFDFMRTDCPRCQALTPVLEQLKAKYGEKIQVLAVVPANGVDNTQTVGKYVSVLKATSPFLFDCGQMTASYLQITPQNPQIHLPHVVIVDKVGMIRREFTEESPGGMSLQTLGAAIDPLLK
jgi:thiol-disulfide isomerase/thioredoxin